LKVISNSHRLNYEYDPALNFGFEDIKTKFSGTLVISVSRMEAVRDIKGDRYYLELEEPNRFLTPYSSSQNREGKDSDRNFKKVFSICPFSTKFFQRDELNKGKYVFFPTNFDHVPKPSKKIYDFVYSGNLHSKAIIQFLKSLKGLNICVIGNSDNALITHRRVNYLEKMKLISESKFAIVHNQLFLDKKQIRQLQLNLPNYLEHGAFSHLPKLERFKIVKEKDFRAPQLKSRLFEAAACGTIPIVMSDPWNLAQDWYERTEFIEAREASLSESCLEAVEDWKNWKDLGTHLREKTEREYSSNAFAQKYF
jgi:glycosyltransferase involved in cell wall biosynthesis